MSFRVALTFDAEHPDRPNNRPGIQEQLIETLARAGLRATFFVQGRWAEAYPDTARLIAPAGHLVGSHSFYHARMPLFSAEGFETDVRDAQTAIVDILGVDPRPWFRCPFGTGADDPRILSQLDGLGYRNVHWNVGPEDWEPSRSPKAIEDSAVDGALTRGDGAVILFHTWPSGTVAALPGIIDRLRDAGADFVRVDELEQVDSGPEETPSELAIQ